MVVVRCQGDDDAYYWLIIQHIGANNTKSVFALSSAGAGTGADGNIVHKSTQIPKLGYTVFLSFFHAYFHSGSITVAVVCEHWWALLSLSLSLSKPTFVFLDHPSIQPTIHFSRLHRVLNPRATGNRSRRRQTAATAWHIYHYYWQIEITAHIDTDRHFSLFCLSVFLCTACARQAVLVPVPVFQLFLSFSLSFAWVLHMAQAHRNRQTGNSAAPSYDS